MAQVALVMALFAALLALPGQWELLRASLPVIRLWSEPEAQLRAQLGEVPYDLLKMADATLPRDASVLLVTPGQDARHLEYTTFHRALYFLAPRPVWWVSPAPSDGTWEARWWISAPLTSESVQTIADERGITHLLVYDVPQPLGLGEAVATAGKGYLLQLDQCLPLTTTAPRPAFVQGAQALRLIPALAVPFVIGFAALSFIRRGRFSLLPVEVLSLSWVLGAGLISVAMLRLNALSLSLWAQIVALSCLAVAGLVWRVKSGSGHPIEAHGGMERGSRPSFLLVPFSLFLSLQVAFVALMAFGQPLFVWDSWVTWGMKARTIFLDGTISPVVYADASRAVTHLDYPLLLPLNQAWLYGWLGVADDRFAGLPSVLFYVALLGVCYSAVWRWGANQTLAFAATAIVASMSQLSLLAGHAFADVPLAALCVISVLYLIRWLDEGEWGALAIAALAAGLMPWTKREGAVLLGVLCVIVVIMSGRSRRAWVALGAVLLAAALLATPWYFFLAWQGVPNSDFLSLTLATAGENLGRLPIISRMALATLLSGWWNFIWPLAAVVAAFGFSRRASELNDEAGALRIINILPLSALLYLAVMGLTYLFSAYVPYEQHIVTSFYRLVAHVAPLPVLWVAYQGIPKEGTGT
jgi:hypothetical protein